MNAYRVLAKTTYKGKNSELSDQRYYFVKAPTHAKAIEIVQSCHTIVGSSDEPLPVIKYDVEEATKLRQLDPIEGTEIFSL